MNSLIKSVESLSEKEHIEIFLPDIQTIYNLMLRILNYIQSCSKLDSLQTGNNITLILDSVTCIYVAWTFFIQFT